MSAGGAFPVDPIEDGASQVGFELAVALCHHRSERGDRIVQISPAVGDPAGAPREEECDLGLPVFADIAGIDRISIAPRESLEPPTQRIQVGTKKRRTTGEMGPSRICGVAHVSEVEVPMRPQVV